MQPIVIENATRHNLKNVDLKIPKDKLVVVTGISGSGKSSLIFDVLFEAGRRAYLQAIGILDDLGENRGYERINGLLPAVAIKQGIIRRSNPRSVVGTKTRLLAYLSSLYADYHNQNSNVDDARTSAHFSFNSPLGMCLQCQGRGYEFALDFDVLLPDTSTTIVEMYQNAMSESRFRAFMKRIARRFDIDLSKPFRELPDEVQNLVLYGVDTDGSQRVGLDAQLQHQLRRGRDIGGVMAANACESCDGYRIGDEARSLTIKGKHIGQLGRMTISELAVFLNSLRSASAKGGKIRLNAMLMRKIGEVIDQLHSVKLEYLTLYRPIPGLSGGESQRLNLMSALNTQIESLLYIFDEPTAGLHEVEKRDLLQSLYTLKDHANALIVVEHDSQLIEGAEHIIDIGPLAGQDGGEVVFQGSYAGLLRSRKSITGQYLSGRKTLPVRITRAEVKRSTPSLRMVGVRTNNLKSVTVNIPLGMMVGIAGVSGSGKSSLIADTLVPALQNRLTSLSERDSNAISPTLDLVRPTPLFRELSGVENVSHIAEVDQSPIGRRSTSNTATYLGVWVRIRDCFAAQPLAKKRKYGAGHFSYNAKGACEQCQGSGQHRMWLGATFVTYPCETCDGLRYQSEILDIEYQQHSITEVLQMSATEAMPLFKDDAPISRMLDVLVSTGMGYIKLGQPTSTLSGGEAQRLKLAKELGRRNFLRKTLFILDEPTTGLSLYDIASLLEMLDELVAQGNSVIIVEHDPKVLSHCDWLIELGPGGGTAGGKVVAKGSPQSLKKSTKSLIGAFLLAGDDDAG